MEETGASPHFRGEEIALQSNTRCYLLKQWTPPRIVPIGGKYVPLSKPRSMVGP
jgi:hypothetical protein